MVKLLPSAQSALEKIIVGKNEMRISDQLSSIIQDEGSDFKELLYFTPLSKKHISILKKQKENGKIDSFYEKLKTASDTLYKALYQVVASLSLMILNFYTIIGLEKGIKQVHENFAEYDKIKQSADEISDELKKDSVRERLFECPVHTDYCEYIRDLVQKYTDTIEVPLIRDHRKKPAEITCVMYEVSLDREHISEVDDINEFLSGRRWGMSDNPQLVLEVADINIELTNYLNEDEKAMFANYFYEFSDHKLQSALRPSRLLMEGVITHNYKTIFATFLNQVRTNLMRNFEVKTVEANGLKRLVYCPKADILHSGKEVHLLN